MRAFAFALSLLAIFVIPWEGVELPVVGAVAQPLGFVLAAVWATSVIATGQIRRPIAFQIACVAFVLWNGMSLFWSNDLERSLAHTMTWVQLAALVYILWDLYRTRAAVMTGLQTYVLGAYVAVGSAVANYFTGQVYYTNFERFAAGDTNPDGFGFIVALGIPVAWYLATSSDIFGTNRWWRFVNFGYIPAAFIGLSLSGTRTALIASLVGMTYGLFSLTRLRFWARAAILVLLVTVGFGLLPYVQTLKSFQRFGTTTTEIIVGDLNNRTQNWREGLNSFADRPLLGIGSNMYRSINSLGKVAHNSFLSVLVELGLVGFVLFATILTLAVVHATSQPKWDARFWFAILTVWAIGASTLTWEYRKTTWLFLALLISHAAVRSQETDHRDPRVSLS